MNIFLNTIRNLISYSRIGLHVKFVCISFFLLALSKLLIDGIYVVNKGIHLCNSELMVFDLILLCPPFFICSCILKRKKWAYMGSLIFSPIYFLFGALSIVDSMFAPSIIDQMFAIMLGIVFIYPMFVFFQISYIKYYEV